MVTQLRSGQRRTGRHSRIAIDGITPSPHDDRATRRQCGQLLLDLLRLIHSYTRTEAGPCCCSISEAGGRPGSVAAPAARRRRQTSISLPLFSQGSLAPGHLLAQALEIELALADLRKHIVLLFFDVVLDFFAQYLYLGVIV